jgi:hypothetical protein
MLRFRVPFGSRFWLKLLVIAVLGGLGLMLMFMSTGSPP